MPAGSRRPGPDVRLLVLSRLRFLHSTRRLRAAAGRRGHVAVIADPLDLGLVLDVTGPAIVRGGRALGPVDVLVPRVGRAGTAHTLAAARQLETMGVPTVNPAAAIAAARDKVGSLQRLARAGLDVPRTALVRTPAALAAALDILGGPPVVLKLQHGTQGVGVILVETRAAIESTLDTLWGLGQDVLIQELVAESLGRDVRALVVDGRVVAAMRRHAREGEWRSNVHRGARVEPVQLDPAFEAAALAATAALDLGVAGVDLLEGRDGPRVLEVNPSPGFEGLERATGVDAAERIVEYAERLAGAGQGRAGGEDQPSADRPRLVR